ncbi:ARM repeat-containing protein [Polychaeton citri CBS 116435]|uniref:ARM repeat-containing protein n=1 Tax=Polychaeton citri CBS 116435 TaxID=1314669 RepID=A0A9P4URP0_9PEZI|nr:ARM repeat-containing protein [Polychaeton citri CBS 116435]
MGGVKRKDVPAPAGKAGKKLKTAEVKPAKFQKKQREAEVDLGDEEDSFDDLSETGEDEEQEDSEKSGGVKLQQATAVVNGANGDADSAKKFKPEGTSSAEAHAKQRQLAKERKAAKPNADNIQRSKKIWERLRRKSHVPKKERDELVAELFTIITGHVRDFVFKHDSVRVIQCAVKYANREQKLNIAKELESDLRALCESKYGKFLVAKLVVEGDEEVRALVIPQFYGGVKRLVNHPEASWIVDDIYRQVASRQQRAIMLREWYGAEFAIENKQRKKDSTEEVSADLQTILAQTPEKRKPVLQNLLSMINPLVQKKMTGFTMLHDAMLQYFQALSPGSEEHTEFLEILKGDIDKDTEGGGGDLYKNLAFTKSGSRLVCLAIAYGSAKDRKVILRVFRDTVEMMAFDTNAKMVLLVSLDVPDDTKMTGQAIYRELLGEKLEDEAQKLDRLEGIIADLNARLPILYPMAGPAKWLLTDAEKALLAEVHEIRSTTSKKDPEARTKALLEYTSPHLLQLIQDRAAKLLATSFGAQFITEAILSLPGDKTAAKKAIADLAEGDPQSEEHIAKNVAASRMLKSLVQGGTFDPKTKSIKLAEPKVGFGEVLYPVIQNRLVEWACSDSSFVVLALLESEDVPAGVKTDAKKALKKGKKQLEQAANDGGKKGKENGDSKTAKKGKTDAKGGNAGARLLLQQI